jgi:hypothetical protein
MRNVGCEDIFHALFNFPRAQKVWQTLGILETINDALTYRSGSLVPEHMILNLNHCYNLNGIGLPELILTGLGTYGGSGLNSLMERIWKYIIRVLWQLVYFL